MVCELNDMLILNFPIDYAVGYAIMELFFIVFIDLESVPPN